MIDRGALLLALSPLSGCRAPGVVGAPFKRRAHRRSRSARAGGRAPVYLSLIQMPLNNHNRNRLREAPSAFPREIKINTTARLVTIKFALTRESRCECDNYRLIASRQRGKINVSQTHIHFYSLLIEKPITYIRICANNVILEIRESERFVFYNSAF